MVREAVVSSGVAYQHGLYQPGELLAGFDIVDVRELIDVDLNQFDLILVPRSSDGDMLFARRHQFRRFLESGGVLVAFGELWANWFPGCAWREECAEDILEPVVVSGHPLVAPFTNEALHWHPARQRWCCHGHLEAPAGAEVLVRNQRGDPWLYIDRETTNGVILASTNLDPDTHTYHRNAIARAFFENLLAWARDEAGRRQQRRSRIAPRMAGLFSGAYFQRGFYQDPEFGDQFTLLPAVELAATDLTPFPALWIPRESNQNVLHDNREKLVRYLEAGGTIVSFDEINQEWLPRADWDLRKADIESVRINDHPMVSHLTPDLVNWHSHGAFTRYPGADVLIEDAAGNVILYLDEASFTGRIIAGTNDPDCHVGFGTDVTRPLLRAILAWIGQPVATPLMRA